MQNTEPSATRCAHCGGELPNSSTPTLIPSIYFRALLLSVMWTTITLAFKTPGSSTAVLIERAGATGVAASFVFLAAFAYISLDALANDVFPERFRSQTLRHYRWTAVASSAVVYLIFGAVSRMPADAPPGSWVLTVSYSVIACITMALALRTRVARYRYEMAVHNANSHQT